MMVARCNTVNIPCLLTQILYGSQTREEGKALLKQISRLRAMGADASAPAHAPPGPEGVAPPGDSGGGSIITERSQPHTAPGGATVPTTAAATEYQTPPNAPRLVPRNIMFTP